MREQYTTVETISWFGRLGRSCLGTVLGLVLFIGSFFLLHWNETRINLAEVAQTAIDISTMTDLSAAQGKPVSVSGQIQSNVPLGDDLFLLPGNFVFVDRLVEMYSWQETEHTERQKHGDGSETKITTYTYDPVWTDDPENSSEFHHSQNHQNPPKAYPNQLFKVAVAQIDRYSLDTNRFTEVTTGRGSCETQWSIRYRWSSGNGINFPRSGNLQLNAQNSRVNQGSVLTANYIFQGKGSPQVPQIGDLRVCYSVLPTGTLVTVFGTVNQANQITPYLSDRHDPFYRLLPGTRTAAIETLGKEDFWWRWGFRVLGFLLMMFGLGLITDPIATFLDIIPGVGSLAGFLLGSGSFFVAFVLASVTILLSRLLHHPGALMIAIGIAFFTLFLLRRRR